MSSQYVNGQFVRVNTIECGDVAIGGYGWTSLFKVAADEFVSTGDCFKTALECVLSNGVRARLIHGHVETLPQRGINHAWVEQGEYVFDISNGVERVVEHDKYYALHRAEAICEYTREEAEREWMRAGHYGPWE